MQTSQRASENIEFSMQSTPAVEAEAKNISSEIQTEEAGEDLWSVWPYCWAIDLYDNACERFHSLHQNLFDCKLTRLNRRQQAEYQTKYWQSWNRDEDDQFELRLV